MIRRLSKVVGSPQCECLRRRRWLRRLRWRESISAVAAEGHVPVCVGEEMERFEVPTALLGRPVFLELLRRSAQEYGYEQSGVLRIPCPASLFRRLLDAERRKQATATAEEAEELLLSFDEWLLSSETNVFVS
ncbi:auxin-responsive protein SAUR71-like [Curcuma longa]|uniref:auxin-responsive protein SAUR71-like n=1 Tax=Curcuma longa TaxID=136217 RepID=UPI003D9F4C57